MIHPYKGNFPLLATSVKVFAPNLHGVYYCWRIDSGGRLYSYYVGRAIGAGVSLCSRLTDHLNESDFLVGGFFGYRVCDNPFEAATLESNEIRRLRPRHNQRIER